MTGRSRPDFMVTGLIPNTGYMISVFSVNPKGPSDRMVLQAFTAKSDELFETSESALTNMDGFQVCRNVEKIPFYWQKDTNWVQCSNKIYKKFFKKSNWAYVTFYKMFFNVFQFTPILGILVTVGAAIGIVFLSISAYFCVRKKSYASSSVPKSPESRPNNTTYSVGYSVGGNVVITESNVAMKKDSLDFNTSTRHNPDVIPMANGKSGRFLNMTAKNRFFNNKQPQIPLKYITFLFFLIFRW